MMDGSGARAATRARATSRTPSVAAKRTGTLVGCVRNRVIGFCPDRDGTHSVTFCASVDGEDSCISRCDMTLYPDMGCREGYVCRLKQRVGDAGTSVAACVPSWDEDVQMLSMCMESLGTRGVMWQPWDHTPESSGGQRCTVDDPVLAGPSVHGVEYRYYSASSGSAMRASCDLTDALWRLGEVLAEYQITQVLHIGTYNCRAIAGTSRLSEHSFADAIDIWGFVDAQGERYILEEHWEHDTDAPSTHKGRVLYEIAHKMHDQRIFHTILTPNYNTAHDNHFHVDLKAGASFLGASPWPDFYLGNDEARWHEACPGHD